MTKQPASSETSSDWRRAALLVLVVLLAYVPVWRAGFVWDDRTMLTANPCIVGPLGFRQLWTTHYADICPLTLSVLWLEHALWGLRPAPYHVVNVLLHAANAVLLWRVLRGLRVPGAFLGATLWALHPVMAESVAWITELKNTLSGVFFLGGILLYLRRTTNGETKSRFLYGLSLGCAALAMAAKSSTVVLPVVLGLCIWWREGRLGWRQVIRLSPLLALAAAAAALTLWTQGTALSLSADPQWARPWPDRLVAAGRAVWFYGVSLLWPHGLGAAYPRWQVHAGNPLEWLPLLGVAAGLALLWRWRGTPWGRSCFLASAYFLVALGPVLGWFDNTIFRYSLVFDHFQYLASMGPLALAGAGVTRLAARWRPALGGTLLLALGTLTWQRAAVYRDEETFWTDAVGRNPASWIGHGNLGSALLLKGRADAARTQYEQALAVNPRYAEAHTNLGVILLRQGKIDEAMAEDEAALALDPRDVEAHSNLGNALLAKGQADGAIRQYESALAINPDYSAAVYFNLGNARYAKGQLDEAITQYGKALGISPAYAEAHSNLGNAFLSKGQPDEAITQYNEALAVDPAYADAHNNLGIALMRKARFDEAAVQFREVLRLAPGYPQVQRNLATAQALARRARLSP